MNEAEKIFRWQPESPSGTARPWMVHLRCVEFHGNLGTPDWLAGGPRYTEARSSRIGALALAERGEAGAEPIGLVNENTSGGSTRPPFRPRRIVSALREVLDNPAATADELVGVAGGPVFPTGCEVHGNIAGLLAGDAVTLRLLARLRPVEGERPGVVADRLPPGLGSREVSEFVASAVQRRPWSADLPDLDQQKRIPVAGIDDLSGGTDTRPVFTASKGAHVGQLRERLSTVYGLTVELPVQLPARSLTCSRTGSRHTGNDLTNSLSQLEQLLD